MLDQDIVLHGMFPYLSLINDLLPLARTSKALYKLVFNEDFW
jgi:hypothetical protein